jgi:hypothetical protein
MAADRSHHLVTGRIPMRLALRAVLVFGSLCAAALAPAVGFGGPYDFGLNLSVDVPREDFANISGTGGGVGLKFLRSIAGANVRARGDFEILFFGEDEHVVEIGGGLYSGVTRHESLRLLAGFEVSSSPKRRWRVYAAPMAGLYYFRSIDRIQFTYYSETSSTQANFGWKVDTGFALTRFRRPWRPRGVELDFGVSYSTVKDGVQTEVGDTKIKTDASEILIHAGVIWHRR